MSFSRPGSKSLLKILRSASLRVTLAEGGQRQPSDKQLWAGGRLPTNGCSKTHENSGQTSHKCMLGDCVDHAWKV